MTDVGKPTRAYPLYALFILIAVCAVVVRLLTPVVEGFFDSRVALGEIAFAMGIGLILTMFLGAIVGLWHYRRWRGLFIGLSIGAFVGPLLGAMSQIPSGSHSSVLIATLVLSVVLIVVGAALRMTGGNDPMPPDPDNRRNSP